MREGFEDFVCINGKELVGFVGVGGNIGGIVSVGFVMFGGDGAKI